MEEKKQINNFFPNSSFYSKNMQDNLNNQIYHKPIKCKQKNINNNTDKNNDNKISSSKENISNKKDINAKNLENNNHLFDSNNKIIKEEEKIKKQTCKIKNTNKNENNKINFNKDDKDFNIVPFRKNKNSSAQDIFLKNIIDKKYINCKNKKNKDNNTKMNDESSIDDLANNENINENNENISNKKLSSEHIKNIKNIYTKKNYFINNNNLNNNIIISNENNINNNNNNEKKNIHNIDNNEERNENNNNNSPINNNKKDNNDKIKNRNLSCKVKKKRMISISCNGLSCDFSNEKDEIILFENDIGVNDCFLNSIIQVLFHLDEFKNKLFQLEIKNDQNNPIYQLYIIFRNYKALSKLYSNNLLNVSLLRDSLHNKYGTYQRGKCGDPMETISQILELIHSQFFQENTNNKNSKFCQNELCPSHSNFLLNLKEIKYCPNCKAKKIQLYDKDCFMYDALSYEILSLVKNDSYKNYKYSLFSKLNLLSQSFGDCRQKLDNCKCEEIETTKKLYLYNHFSPYLIINITWDTDFPKKGDICKIYGLIPIVDDNRKLFGIDLEKGKKTEKDLVTNYYLYSMILYGQNHYTCFFYNKIIDKWSFIDDNNKKNFDTYNEIINYLIERRSIPVGIIFYHKYNFNCDNSDKFMLNEEEFEKLYLKSLANDQTDIEEKKIEEIVKNKNNNIQKNNKFLEKQNINKNINNQNFENRNNYNKKDNDNMDIFGEEHVVRIKRNKKKVS